MSFSIKWLFAIVALAAIFTAALVYRTPLWATVAVNTAVVVLLAATIGVSLLRLNRTFWLPFCIVGWFYLLASFLPLSMKHVLFHMPSKHIAYLLRPSEVDVLLEARSIGRDYRMGLILFEAESVNNLADAATLKVIVTYRRAIEIIDALFALLAGTFAGVISILLIRHKREA